MNKTGSVNEDTNRSGVDVSGYVRRVRRIADLSQRELASSVGVGQSTISRAESGRDIALALFARILAAAGLRISIVDADGVETAPVPPDVLRDAAGRRAPAHLDVYATPDRPIFRLLLRSVDPTPRGSWYHRRRDRDRLRTEAGIVPYDQPTVSSLAAGRREREAARRRRKKAAAQPELEQLFRRYAAAAGHA
jgi:HTH-type transcriptional regulator/antitoxin HipB